MDPDTNSDIRTSESAEEIVQEAKNKFKIVCIRCPSVILNPKLGTFTPDIEFQLPKMNQKKNAPEPETDTVNRFFRVDDMFHFENVGFSNPAGGVKYLICADCEYGPVGYSKDNVSYVAVPRVRYHFTS